MSLLLAALLIQGEAPQALESCSYDERALLSLDQEKFDQDVNGGWRELAARPGCKLAAADLIAKYRSYQESKLQILFWHEGQVRASAGEQVEQSIALFERSRKTIDRAGWNAYVDATISFLRNDRPALLEARSKLAATPMPSTFPERFRARWPLNLDVVDGLIACFGKSYKEAYGSKSCRELGAEMTPKRKL